MTGSRKKHCTGSFCFGRKDEYEVSGHFPRSSKSYQKQCTEHQVTGGHGSESERHSVVSTSLRPQGLESTRLLCPWNSPGKNTGVGSHSLLQRIFPTQGLNLGLLRCRRILYHLNQEGILPLNYIRSSNL